MIELLIATSIFVLIVVFDQYVSAKLERTGK